MAIYSEIMDVRHPLRHLVMLSGTSATTPAALSNAAGLALGHIAVITPRLFVATVSSVVVDTKDSAPSAVLKVIRKLVIQQPMVLLAQLGRMCDLIIKCLDPAVPRLREQCFKIAGSIIRDMVSMYPMISSVRLQNAQRLAVGDAEGFVTVYDLRTATRWQHFQAHTKPITALAVSQDGKTVATFSVDEKTVKVFHMSGGMFGIMASSAKCTKTFVVSAGDATAMTPQDQLEKLTLSWTSKTEVTLLAPGHVHLSFSM